MKRILILLQLMAIHLAVFSQSHYSLKFDEKEFSLENVIIKNGVNVIFEAKQNIKFDNGFKTELGGTFQVRKF